MKSALQLSAAYKGVTPVGGFNRKWGLPLPQAYALAAGSVFVYEAVRPLAADDVRQLEAEGLGLRRVEGFGRVTANWHTNHATLTASKVEPRARQLQTVSLGSESRPLAERMVQRMLRRELDRRLDEYVYSLDLGQRRWPSKAQLSRLRIVALNALPKRNLGRLSEFLSEDKLKPRAREQYHRARIEGGVRLLDWLRARLKEPAGTWDRLDSQGIEPPQLGDVQAELDDELAREYTIRLVAGVLHRAGKERPNE
jgi:CRISPR-associated protein Csx10